jgi:HEAT repeat protein
VRRITAEALASIGPRAKSAIGPLIEILNDQGNNDWVRSNAVLALAALGPETEVVVEALSSALSDPSEKVRSAAKQTLQTIMSKT